MVETTSPPLDGESLAPFPVRRFTVDEYQRLGQIGILTEDDRVELLEGWIVSKMNLNPPHSASVQLVDHALRSRLPSGWCVRIQDAITTADSEPEPDVVLVRGTARDYTRRHPRPRDIGLVVEVADTSLARDRYKCGLYARAEIPTYWIVNLVERCVETFGDPTGPDADPRYRQYTRHGPDEYVRVVLDGREAACLQVRDLLP